MYRNNIYKDNYKNKYAKYKKKYMDLKSLSQSTTIGLFKKGNQNYRTLLSDTGGLYHFKEKSIGDIKKEDITKDVRIRDKSKVLVIDAVHNFDQFTNKYGMLKFDGQLIIRWELVARDYKGFYLDKNDELKLARYSKAIIGTIPRQYKSWWSYEYHYNDAIIFYP